MIDNSKVGVGIITCNRKEAFEQLWEQVSSNQDIDSVVAVKNLSFDYGLAADHCIEVKEDKGVGFCKNVAMKQLLNNGCEHIFLIEDDMKILDPAVFSKHIFTAKHFHLGHLNWNTLPEVKDNPTYVIEDGDFSLDISYRLCGCFSYFSAEALQQCGLIDAKHYVNALEHAEHAYRFAAQGLTTPFYSFAGIHDAAKMLTNIGEGSSTIDHESTQYKLRLLKAQDAFTKTYGKKMIDIPRHEIKDVIAFLRGVMNEA